jgi:rotatin
LLAALTEMREAVIADLPIQALLQDKTTAVEAVVGLARGFDGIPIDEKGGVAAGAVRTAALATLRTFAKAIKAAIGHAADGAHRAHPPRYDDEFPAFHVTSRAALSYPPPPGGLAQAAGVEVDADGKRVGKGDDADAEAKIVAALSEKAAPVATLPTAHLIAQSVIPLISSPDVAGDALLALEEFLPLLELTRVDLGEGGKSLPPRTFSSVAARLAAYANSMEAALGRAAASVSINGEDELLPTGECPAFFPALALVAVMITAAGSEAAGLLGGGFPKRLTKRL